MALKDKLTSFATTVGGRANNAIENGKLGLKINGEERKIAEYTLHIGELIVERLDAGETFDDEIASAKASLAGPERDALLYSAEENLFGEGGFPVCPIYYYTNMYCMNGLTNVGYTTMGYFFFWNAQQA